MVHGNLLAADAENVAGRVINVANGRSVTLLRMLAALNDLLGTKIQPSFEPARLGDVRDSLADITLARRLLEFEPQVEFEEGLRRSIDYYRSISS